MQRVGEGNDSIEAMRLTRGISIAVITLIAGQLGLLRALHGPSGAHQTLHSHVSADGHSHGPNVPHQPSHSSPSPTEDGGHTDCTICHLIAQVASAVWDSATPPVDRTALPPQRLWPVHIVAESQDVYSPIAARAPPSA